MVQIDKKSSIKKESIEVGFFYENVKKHFNIELLNSGKGLNRKILDQNLHRPGLALAGFVELFSYSRVQIFGNTEIRYLKNLTSSERKKSLTRIFNFEIPCIILTDGNKPLPELAELSEQFSIPIFGTTLSTTKAVFFVSDFLDDQFSPRASLHGSFVDVYGIGIMFIGKSGIGKSEVALDLIERGHRLVADDVVILTKKGEGILMGSGTNIVKHFMEIRGLGFIDVEKMFGIRAIRFQKRLEIVVELEVWNKKTQYTRTGLDTEKINILDVDIPYVKLPILPGKNITVISEVIALNYLLKHYGYDPAVVLQERLSKEINKGKKVGDRGIDYFEHDFE